MKIERVLLGLAICAGLFPIVVLFTLDPVQEKPFGQTQTSGKAQTVLFNSFLELDRQGKISAPDTTPYLLGYKFDKVVTRLPSGEQQIQLSVHKQNGYPSVQKTTFTFRSPVQPLRVECQIIYWGTRKNDCLVKGPGSLMTFEATRSIGSDESMAVTIVYPAGTFSPLVALLSPPLLPLWAWLVIIHVAFVGLIWLLIGRDAPGRGVIIPNEELIHEIKPYEAGALLAQGANYPSYIALILDLARRKIIRLERVEAGGYLMFDVVRASNKSVKLDSLEEAVLNRLMAYPTEKVTNRRDEAGQASLDRRSGQSRLAYRLFETRVNQRLVERGWFAANALQVQILSICILSGWTYGLFLLLNERLNDPQLNWMFLQIGLAAPIIYFLPRLTKAGALARERVKGLAKYVEVAEKDRLNFHETPQRSQDKKNELLPYAVAFNLQKDWTKHYQAGYEEVKGPQKERFDAVEETP